MTIPQGTTESATLLTPGAWLLVRCGCGYQVVQVVDQLDADRLRVRRWLHSRRRFTHKPGTAAVNQVRGPADKPDEARYWPWYLEALRAKYQAAVHDDRQRRFF